MNWVTESNLLPGFPLTQPLSSTSNQGLRWTVDSMDYSQAPNYLQIITTASNGTSGETFGAELTAKWQATESLRLQGTYSLLESDLDAPASLLPGRRNPALAAPEHQFSVRSSLDITRDVDFDLWLRYVDRIDAAGAAIPGTSFPAGISDYLTLDARLAWRPYRTLELSIVGQNLLESPHREFNPSYYSTQATELSRCVFGKVTWKF